MESSETPSSKSVADIHQKYKFIKQIGEGAFGQVYLGRNKETGQLVAIKELDKGHIVKVKKTEHVKREKIILNLFASHPNVVKLEGTFQTDSSLYFVFEHCPYGTLSDLIKLNDRLKPEVVKIYAAQIINVLETVHGNNVMHRDMKPENILVTKEYNLKVIDFGDSHYIQEQPLSADGASPEELIDEGPGFERRGTFVGTAFYVAPEMLQDNISTASGDLWALGCIIYKMLTGDVPFKGSTDYFTFQMIINGDYKFPDYVQEDAQDLIRRLLQKNPMHRLGAGNTFADLKRHPFFDTIRFDMVNNMTIPLEKKYNEEEVMAKYQEAPVIQPVEEIKEDPNALVHQGELKKKNKYFWNQVRLFKLYRNGRIEYFKDRTQIRGSLQLEPNSQVIMTAKDKFEIKTQDRTFYISESETERFSMEKWLEKLREVIDYLKKQTSQS